MLILILGLVLFIGMHSVGIVAPSCRQQQVAARGEATWKALYSLISAIGLVLIIYGYGLARQTPVVLYAPPMPMRHVALLLMLPVFPLLLATYLPGRIRRAAKHPTLLAVKLWALAHLLANGMLADVVLFGTFLVWAIADRIAVKRRVNPHQPPAAPARVWNDAIAVVGGLGIYLAFLFGLHAWLIGVSPMG